MSATVADLYKDPDDFEQLLSRAEAQASSDWEQSFCSDMNGRWEKYGAKMFLSSNQVAQLERIAKE